MRGVHRGAKSWLRLSSRPYQTFSRASQQGAAAISTGNDVQNAPLVTPRNHSSVRTDGIRVQLRQWNELHGHQPPGLDPGFASDVSSSIGPVNSLSRLQDEKCLQWRADEQDGVHAQGYDGHGLSEGDHETEGQDIFLKMGDLVEIPFAKSEQESLLAVFVRRVSGMAQCYAVNGRWLHINESLIPYSISEWIPPHLVEPILSHLPDAADLEDREALAIQAKMEDLSVPRALAAPVVERLLAFDRESREIYRRNASTLDLAHDILAHDTDLRYGSLTSAAGTLLKMSPDRLTAPALFTVRKAISNAGFGFNVDGTAHRVTGYMQILSKAQVELVDRVRGYIRQWQEDSSIELGMNASRRSRRSLSPGAQIINGYLSKAREIVLESRKTRMPTHHGVLGPSSVRIPLTQNEACIRVTTKLVFTEQEQDITRFIEAWAVPALFRSHPRLSGMGPLLLQATGLYSGFDLTNDTGLMFLQELGTFLPFDNPRRFDANLLLPTSQHSRPLQVLGSRLSNMYNNPGFSDTMADLRHDWGNVSVFCIDRADAQEIDDGLSVERAEEGPDGRRRYWIHVHVANPTAFFDKDSPFAKMARHMGETVYMPERTYPMLPPWVPSHHFSLGNDRPCLTISAKLDEDGATLEHKITSGVVRNVIRLTPDEINDLMNVSRSHESSTLVLTVGGKAPPPPARKSAVHRISADQVADLQVLQRLSQKRLDMRKASGGISFEIPRPDVGVYSHWGRPGLGHNHPFRAGSRLVEGDPIIVYRTAEFRNWFNPLVGMADTLVREMMLLACETSARWCAERDIPIVYRGTTKNPEGPTPSEFRRDMLIPQLGHDGEIPMHLGLQYMKTLGPSVLHSAPIRHDIMGMEYYTKATSPLRRYGDMILHWQIQAALRREAETGQSLVDRSVTDRSFLPFSASMLNSITRSLRPRERTVMLAKRHTERYWFLMLLMRRHFFGEDGGLPYETLRIMTTSDLYQNGGQNEIVGLSTELNFYVSMHDPHRLGLGKAKMGDVWECKISQLDVYYQKCFVTPIRLLERHEG